MNFPFVRSPRSHTRIVLVGPGAAGKDWLRDWFLRHVNDFRSDVSFTTRSPRVGEQNGREYNFVSHVEFERMKENDELYECVQFGQQQYGTGMKSWHESHIFIMSPGAVASMSEIERGNCLIVYMNPSKNVLMQRLRQRYSDDPNADTVINTRRCADKSAFKDFTDYDVLITDHDMPGIQTVEALCCLAKNHTFLN